MSIIDDLIARFEPVSLGRMDQVKLLNRVDTKFVLSRQKLPEILSELMAEYFILEINGVRLQHYETRYFDTPEKTCYLNHHNQRLNRFKIRARCYADSGLCYFEIKSKNNKGRTSKERKKLQGLNDGITPKAAALLTEVTGLDASRIVPSIEVGFSRITLVNRRMTERATIDVNLRFSGAAEQVDYPGIAIAEVKQDRLGRSGLNDVLNRHHIREFKISKYCLGIISLYPQIKQNNFKQKLHYIKKLNHDVN